jgi:hypothetical protein
MEKRQMDVVVLQQAEATVPTGKGLSRVFWNGLNLAALLFWLYAIVKVFVFDIDVYLVSLISSNFVWLLNYKFLILLSVILIAMFITRSLVLGFAVVYVALYPFVILFWKLPRFIWKQQSWLCACCGGSFANSPNLRFNNELCRFCQGDRPFGWP